MDNFLNTHVSSPLSKQGQDDLYRLAADIHHLVEDVSGIIDEDSTAYAQLLQDLWSHTVGLYIYWPS